MDKEQILQTIGLGAAAGLIGTAAMEAVHTANHKTAAEPVAAPGQEAPRANTAAPVQESTGAFLKTAVSVLSTGFGSVGAALVVVRSEREVLVEGALLGTGVWAIGHLTQPASSRSQSPRKMVWSLAQHMLFGIATVKAYRRLKRSLA